MSKKKKNLADELVDLKVDEMADSMSQSEDLDIDFGDIDATIKQGQSATDRLTMDSAENKTIRLVHTNTEQLPPTPAKPEAKDYHEEVKVSYGLPANQQVPRAPEPQITSKDGELKHSEHMRVAQRKINELEDEAARLRREVEEIASAAETFKKLNDEYYAEIENLKSKIQDQKQTANQEINLLKRISQNKDKQINELKQQIDDYKSRIDNNFQRVRKREKDLEHRLEIAKIEEAAVMKSKDQLILDLKRRIDEITNESGNFRRKSQENYKELQRKQQVARGAIRAMRIALTKLEGEDDSDYEADLQQGGSEDEQ